MVARAAIERLRSLGLAAVGRWLDDERTRSAHNIWRLAGLAIGAGVVLLLACLAIGWDDGWYVQALEVAFWMMALAVAGVAGSLLGCAISLSRSAARERRHGDQVENRRQAVKGWWASGRISGEAARRTLERLQAVASPTHPALLRLRRGRAAVAFGWPALVVALPSGLVYSVGGTLVLTTDDDYLLGAAATGVGLALLGWAGVGLASILAGHSLREEGRASLARETRDLEALELAALDTVQLPRGGARKAKRPSASNA